jgi:leader peptidase (prepilin peptidase)/N-methyltransferase
MILYGGFVPRLLVFYAFAAAISLVDMREMRIPDSLLLGLALFLLFFDLYTGAGFIEALKTVARGGFGAAAVFCFFYALYRIQGGIGFGDVKYIAVISYAVGIELIIPAVVLACAAALVLFLVPGFAGRRIPFAPFLSAGGIAASVLSKTPLFKAFTWGIV